MHMCVNPTRAGDRGKEEMERDESGGAAEETNNEVNAEELRTKMEGGRKRPAGHCKSTKERCDRQSASGGTLGEIVLRTNPWISKDVDPGLAKMFGEPGTERGMYTPENCLRNRKSASSRGVPV